MSKLKTIFFQKNQTKTQKKTFFVEIIDNKYWSGISLTRESATHRKH